MKLMVPVVGIMFASGICCCGDFLTNAVKEGVEKGMEAAGQQASTGTEAGPTSTAPEVTVSSGGGGGGLVTVDGACGPFKDMGVKAPSGFSIMVCSNTGSSSSLVMQGSGDPIELCKPLKGWVESQGYSITAAAAMSGTSSIVARKGGQNFVVACTDSTGQTLVSYSLTSM